MTTAGSTSLAAVFGMTDFMVPMVLGDLAEEQARARPRGEGGPSIAWTVGHLLYCRISLLNRFGGQRENPYQTRFGNVAASDGSDYPSLDELRSAWDEVATDFSQALTGLTDEALDEVLTDGWYEGQTLRDQVVFLAWHEGYHFGAVGQIRKQLGLPGPAERVQEVRKGAG